MKIWPWLLLVLAGVAFYFAVESVWKAAAVVAGSILIDIGIDEALLNFEKRRGKV